jgi:trans-2,3-dihydro-3-hydroxyanthranilate isomerase
MSDPMEQLARYEALAGGDGAAARRYVVLDVFADVPLQGNPLAVFLDGRDLDDQLMQRLARELNLSETVFLLPARDGGDLRARIFTPATELPFAGHPVIGSAVVAAAALGRRQLTLETGAGPVALSVSAGSGRAVRATMSQPAPAHRPYEHRDAVLRALGVERAELPVDLYDNGPRHVFVALSDEDAVGSIEPDLRALARLGDVGVNCFAGNGTRYKTRMFAPGLGVAEDPATGSAAGPLALHLARHGRIAFGEEIEIRQGQELGRPSLLLARAVGSPERAERIEVAGSALVLADARLAL